MPSTRPSLLIRLRDRGDEEAWGQVVQLYAPLVYDYGRRRALQDGPTYPLTGRPFAYRAEGDRATLSAPPRPGSGPCRSRG